jgi:predicted transcriptional regulator
LTLSDDQTSDVTALTGQLLCAYLANNTVAPEELAGLIRSTRVALTAEEAAPATIGQPETFAPAVSVRKSFSSPEHIISLIDAKPYKTLKRHLASHGLTPESYRERYNLASSYPMVAPAYAAHRRGIAQKIGLGRRKPADESVEPQDASQVALIQAAAQSAKPGSGKPPVSAGPPSKRGNAAASGEGRSNSALSSDTAEMDDTLNGAAALLTSELSPAAADKKRPSRKAKQGCRSSRRPGCCFLGPYASSCFTDLREAMSHAQMVGACWPARSRPCRGSRASGARSSRRSHSAGRRTSNVIITTTGGLKKTDGNLVHQKGWGLLTCSRCCARRGWAGRATPRRAR